MMRSLLHPAAADRYAADLHPATIALAGLSAAQTISAGMASSRAAKHQAALASQQAAQARQLAAIREARQRRDLSRQQATQRARFAASGIRPTAGSALLAQEDLAAHSELEALLTRWQGASQAHRSEQDAVAARARARAARNNALLSTGRGLLAEAEPHFKKS